MLRKKKDNSDYEIDRELTGKFAIEKNAEYQEKIEQLEEENKKLREELSKYNEMEEHIEDGLLTPIPNVWSHEEEIRRLKIENKKLREENEMLRCSKGGTPEKVGHEEMIQYLMEENKKLKKENEELKEYKLMYEGLIN